MRRKSKKEKSLIKKENHYEPKIVKKNGVQYEYFYPYVPESMVRLAQYHLQQGNAKESVKILDNLLKKEKRIAQNQGALLTLARAYHLQKDLSKAIDAYRSLLRIAPPYIQMEENKVIPNPMRTEGLLEFGTLLLENGEAMIALDVLGELLVYNSRNYKVLNLLGIAYSKLDLPDKAIDMLVIALGIDPAPITYWKYVAEFLKLGGKLNILVEALDQSIGFDDIDNQTRKWIAEGYYKERNFEKTIQFCEKIVSGDPKVDASWNMLAIARGKLGLIDEAINAAQRAVSISPKAGIYWCNLGELHAANGEPTQAEVAYRKAIECHSKYLSRKREDILMSKQLAFFQEKLENITKN